MSLVLLAARLGIAALFAVAAVAKLADREGSRDAARGFGVPARFAGTVGIGLPLLELAVAALLVPAGSARVGAAAAFALLLVFCAAIALAMARGDAPDCHCFGALHSAPAGPATLLRNAVLAAMAAAVAAGTPVSVTGRLGEMTSPERVAVIVAAGALAVAAGCAALAWHLLRAHGRLLLRIDALEGASTDEPAPSFTLPGLEGPPQTLERLRAAGRPVLLVFTNPKCGPCRTLMPSVARWQRTLPGSLTVAVISSGRTEDVRAEAAELGLSRVLLSPDRAVADAYGATGTPAAVLIGPDGRRRGRVATGREAVEALVASLAPLPLVEVPARPRLPEPGPSVGEAVPPIDLPTLDGGRFVLSERHRPVLLISWNPGCGFCRAMTERLREALASAGPDSAEVVLIARGSADDNRALDPPATVALDADGSVAAKLGASGTPIGLLVDELGRVAAGPAVGATAALELVSPEPAPLR